MSSVISSERHGRVRRVVMNNPGKKNALDREAMSALTAAMLEAADDDETRVVVLSGAGGAFCTGADLRAVELPTIASPTPAKTDDSPREPEFNDTIRSIWNLPKPVFAAVGGIAAGFGCSLALACDVRIASAAARFSLVFVKRGLALDGGATFFLPRLAALNGLEMALTGDVIGADEALRLGLVNRVVPADAFEAHVDDAAERMAKNAPLALAAIKQAVHRALGATLDETLRDEVATVRTLVRTEDVREGVASFLEKREPLFRGK